MTVANSFGSRLDRAQELAGSGRIVRSGDEFLVPSLGSELVYRVRLDGDRVTCNCPDYVRNQRECKHCIAAAIVAQREMSKV